MVMARLTSRPRSVDVHFADAMDEYVSAVARFAEDLRAAGIPRPHLSQAMSLYRSALFEPSQEAWGRLYRHVSQTLQQWCGKPLDPGAARRLFAFIDDDFGRSVLELPVRTRLRELLLRHHVAS
jgi:hypothetical protein